MQAIKASQCYFKIKELDLRHCNWDDNANCEELANLLAEAPILKEVDISFQVDSEGQPKIEQKICIEVTPQTVKITRSEAGQLICAANRR